MAKKKDEILFEYRRDACSSMILTSTCKTNLDDDEIWVRAHNHYFRITIDCVLTINGKNNPDYQLKYFEGDYCPIK